MNGSEACVSSRLNRFEHLISYVIVLVVATSLMSNMSLYRGWLKDSSEHALLSGEGPKTPPPEEGLTTKENPSNEPQYDELPSDLSAIIEFEKAYNPIILSASQKYQIDPFLIKAMIIVESGCNPKAVSPRGAKGLMQLMPRTAKALGAKNLFNPSHNIHAGTKYFKDLLDQFKGDTKLALAAYNAGSQNVLKYGGIPPYPETNIFVKRVFRLMNDFQKREFITMQNVGMPHA